MTVPAVPGAVSAWEWLHTRPRDALPVLMAHRGASDELPENTLPAFALALEQGAEVLETDIRFTRDDQLVLMHDATVDRTTNGTGAVAAMTLREFQQLRARRPGDPAPGPTPPPSLAEFLSWTATRQPPLLALELKDDRFLNPRDAARLIELLAAHDALARVALLSFSPGRVRACKQIAAAVPVGIITLRNPFPLYETELLGPFYPLLYVNPFYVAWARRRGQIACPLDPSPEPRLRFYRRLGAPVLLTNHPAVTRDALRAL